MYLGSRSGKEAKFVENAFQLGRLLTQSGIRIVYGGASVGTMKALADGAAEAGGEIIGVFPAGFLGKKDNADAGIDVGPGGLHLTQVIYTKDLDERIATMESLADAMIFLPGSFGTMVEAFKWMEGWQLGYHSKPAFVLNTDGYYNHLLEQARTMIDNGFMDGFDMDRLFSAATPEELLDKLTAQQLL